MLVERGRATESVKQPSLGRYRPIMGAIAELSTERQIGMSIGPIPVSAIEAYLSKYGLPEWWMAVITRVDAYMLDEHSKSIKEAS